MDIVEPEPEVTQDEVPEPPKTPITKPGDVWRLGDHWVTCGDAREFCTAADCVVTDPPYGMAFRSNYRKSRHPKIDGDEGETLLLWSCEIPVKHSKYVWCRWDNLASVPRPTSTVTWVKNNWSMGDLKHEHARQTEVCLFYPGEEHKWPTGRPSDVIHGKRTGNELHPSQKPLEVIAEIVQWTKGMIADPFLGSGTTLIAAEQLNRVCHGIEIEPKYVDVVIERWENLTGGKAKRA